MYAVTGRANRPTRWPCDGGACILSRVPLGVARVLIADMESEGLVRVYQPQLEAGVPDKSPLERVLSGLRRL